jgi:probable phosphoglycerate mutase
MFIIVRHGNTFEAGEPPRRIGARTDLPLTAAGTAQGHALGAHFAAQGWRFSRVLVSPLVRTRATALAILGHQPPDALVTPEPCDWLREIDHGPDEDMTEDAVLARIGAAALAAWDERAEPPPGWTVDAEARIAGWRRVFGQAEGVVEGPTLLVTSNGAARFALRAAGLEVPGGLKLPTGSYGTILRKPDGALDVAEWGRRP